MMFAMMTSDGKKELPWWFNGSWREREQRATEGPPHVPRAMPRRHMNPHCVGLHDRTSYSINTCDKCRQWSEPPPPDAPATPPHHPV